MNDLQTGLRSTVKATAPAARSGIYHGWRVAGAAFLIALFGWGLGFYGPGIYLVALQARHGWSVAEISSAITAYYLLGATLILFVGRIRVFRGAHRRRGRRDRDGLRRPPAAARLAAVAGLCGVCRDVVRLGRDERRCHQHHHRALVRQAARPRHQPGAQRRECRRHRDRAASGLSHRAAGFRHGAVVRRWVDARGRAADGGVRAAAQAPGRARWRG